MAHPILVVEDNLTEQFVIRHLLLKFGYRVVIAGSAEEALVLFKENTFAAILMDLTLPGFSGFVCAKQIRQLEGTDSHIPIIAFTACTEQSARDQAREVGMDAYFVKPFVKEELRIILAHYVASNDTVNQSVLESVKLSQSARGFT